MLERVSVEIDRIRVPVKRRKTLDPEKAAALAESILEEGQKTPISVRADGDGFILVEGLHRLEACRSLGETTIVGTVVRAKLR
jgi:ParB-like chromosome segregation protein Spo0J